MKLIIDIPEDVYTRHKWRVNSDMCTELDIAVAKGTPLDDIKADIERKANSGQWSEATVYGMQKALFIIDKHIGKEKE